MLQPTKCSKQQQQWQQPAIATAAAGGAAKDHGALVNKNSSKFIDQLKKASAGDSIIDFQEHANYLTLDVICDTAMGVPINAMEQRDSSIVQAFRE